MRVTRAPGGASRVAGDQQGGAVTSSGAPAARERLLVAADVSLGAAWICGRLATRVARGVGAVAGPVAGPVVKPLLRPPLVPQRWQPAQAADDLVRRGHEIREDLVPAALALIDRVLPWVVEQVLRRVDLTDVVRRHVDVDAIVAGVDLDGIVARVDIATVVARVDVDAIAASLDVDAVAARLDVDAVLDRLDLTDLALHRLDMPVLVSAVLDQVDLVAIAEQVIDAVDLPDIIRESSGALTSDTVRGARVRSAAADQAIGRVRDRLFLRRHGNGTGLPAVTGPSDPPPAAP
jgi:hypothetical protein